MALCAVADSAARTFFSNLTWEGMGKNGTTSGKQSCGNGGGHVLTLQWLMLTELEYAGFSDADPICVGSECEGCCLILPCRGTSTPWHRASAPHLMLTASTSCRCCAA